MERKEETKAVKRGLVNHGINARVGHGRGTAWGWLEINVGKGQQFGDEHRRAANIIMHFAVKIALEITGRRGDYDGRISCLTQDHWTDKKGSIPIIHDLDKLKASIPELAA